MPNCLNVTPFSRMKRELDTTLELNDQLAKRTCLRNVKILEKIAKRGTETNMTILPMEIITCILSYCDYHSVINAMTVDEVLNKCGGCLLNKMEYWKNLCVKEISPYDLNACVLNEPSDNEKYKWINRKCERSCVMGSVEINLREPNQCHGITVQHSRKVHKNMKLKKLLLRESILAPTNSD